MHATCGRAATRLVLAHSRCAGQHAIVRRHLAAAAAGVPFGEIFQAELARRHATSRTNPDPICTARYNRPASIWIRDRRQRFVPHSRHMKVSFALAIQILLAQVAWRLPHVVKSRSLSSLLSRGIRHDLTPHLRIDNHTDSLRKENKMGRTTSALRQSRGVDRTLREYLLVSASTPIVSLGEGNTPLIYCPRLSKRIGRGCEVFVKNEA